MPQYASGGLLAGPVCRSGFRRLDLGRSEKHRPDTGYDSTEGLLCRTATNGPKSFVGTRFRRQPADESSSGVLRRVLVPH